MLSACQAYLERGSQAYEAYLRGDDVLGLDVGGSTKPKSELTFFERQAMQSTNQRRQAIGKQVLATMYIALTFKGENPHI